MRVERVQVMSFEPGVYAVVDTFNGVVITSIPDETFAAMLADDANLVFAEKLRVRLEELRAREMHLCNVAACQPLVNA